MKKEYTKRKKFIGIETKNDTIQIESENQRNHPKILIDKIEEEDDTEENIINTINILNKKVSKKIEGYTPFSCIPKALINDSTFDSKVISE
jgi:hypothetical protein